MDDLLKCSICLKKFEDPRLLDCQHTFCLKPCLEQIYEPNMATLKCPQCCYNHIIVQGNLELIPKNLVVIQNLLHLSKCEMKEEELCFNCKRVSDSFMMCDCCNKTICDLCNRAHMQKTIKQMEMLSTTFKCDLSKAQDISRTIVKRISEVDKKQGEIIRTTNSMISTLISILQNRKLELLNEIRKTFEEDYKTLKSLQELKEVDIAVLSSSLHSITSLLEKKDVSHNDLLSLLTSLHNMSPPQTKEDILEGVETKDVFFSYDIQEAKECILKMGKIKSSQKITSEVISSSENVTKEEVNVVQIPSPKPTSNPIISRDKTYILNRPAKSISFDISINDPTPLYIQPVNQSLLSKYQSKTTPIIIFGTKGQGPGEFIWPRGIVIDDDNRSIIVADSSNHRIQIFSDTGKCQKIISEIIIGPDYNSSSQCKTSFDCLSGITMDKHQKIICSDRYNHRVVVMDIDGRLINEIGKDNEGETLLSYPWGIAVDSRNNILICDKDNHRIQVFSKEGKYVKQIGCLGREQGSFDNPHYLSICPRTQNIFVSDTSNHRIQIFTQKGEFLSSFTGDGPSKFHLKYPRGIIVDIEGNILVSDSGNNRISIFTAQGKLIHMFGSHGSNAGQFKGLEGISVFNDGRIVISDRDNHRIQIF